MRRVAIYARVSTEHEAQISALGNQIQYYDNIMNQHPDWVLYERYIDEGLTGTSIHKRPNFLRMIRDAENGKFDLIITREVSRFARNTVDTLQETRKLKKCGVEVYFTEDNIWTFKDDDGELKLTLMATLAQNESKKLSQRIKAGQTITFQNGVFYGTGNILGYDRVGKEAIINQEQAKTVRLIFDMYLKGEKTKEIQYELERRGYKTATGLTKWDSTKINRILRNSFYCGTIEYRKSYVPDYLEQKHKKNNGEVEKIYAEGKHEPIVTKEEFATVQKLLKSRMTYNKDNVTNKGLKSDSIWVAKLICSCGSSMSKQKYHSHPVYGTTYSFQCRNQKSTGSYNSRLKAGLSTDNICQVKSIAEWKLKLIAYVIFNKLFKERNEIIKIINNLLDESIKVDSAKKVIETELDVYYKRYEDLKRKKAKLLDTYMNDLVDQDIYKEKKKEYDEEIEKITNYIKDLNSNVPTLDITEKINGFKNTISEKFKNQAGDLSEDMVDGLIDKIIINETDSNWHLKFTNDIIDVSNNEEQEIKIAELVITKDDAERYSKYCSELSRVKFKENLKVNLFI